MALCGVAAVVAVVLMSSNGHGSTNNGTDATPVALGQPPGVPDDRVAAAIHCRRRQHRH